MGHDTFEGTTVEYVTHADNNSVWTIVVAAGSGSRFGKPKQFETLDGSTVLEHSIATALSVSEGLVVVLPSENVGTKLPARCEGVAGGATRSESVRAGLA